MARWGMLVGSRQGSSQITREALSNPGAQYWYGGRYYDNARRPPRFTPGMVVALLAATDKICDNPNLFSCLCYDPTARLFFVHVYATDTQWPRQCLCVSAAEIVLFRCDSLDSPRDFLNKETHLARWVATEPDVGQKIANEITKNIRQHFVALSAAQQQQATDILARF